MSNKKTLRTYQIIIIILLGFIGVLLYVIFTSNKTSIKTIQKNSNIHDSSLNLIDINITHIQYLQRLQENKLIQEIYEISKIPTPKISDLSNIKVASGATFMKRLYGMISEKNELSQRVKISIANVMWKMQEDDINNDFLNKCDQQNWRTGLWAGYYQFFVPTIGCESVYRAGLLGDGGKHLCNPHKFLRNKNDRKCIVYSFGAESDISFENAMHWLLDCNTFTFDPTLPKKKKKKLRNQLHPYNAFYEWGIGPIRTGEKSLNGNPLKTLTEITTELNHDYVDVLKVDIEENEVSVFDHIFNKEDNILNRLGVKLLLIEYHFPGGYDRFDCTYRKKHLYPFIKMFYDNGFYMYRYEHNVYTREEKCPGLCCIEYAFIKKEFI